MPNPLDVSVIIVSYNTRELLRECIESLRSTDSPVRAECGTGVPARAEPPPSGTDNPVRAECGTGVPARAEPPPSGTDNPARAECGTGVPARVNPPQSASESLEEDTTQSESGMDARDAEGTDRNVCATGEMGGTGGDARATGATLTGGDARATGATLTGGDARATVEIIVIDNASSDGSAPMVAECFPEVKLIANPDNRGFGAACNQGLQIAQGRYALILNADIRAVGNAIERLVQFMDAHPDAAACGGQLRYPDGRIQPSCARELTLWWVFCEQSLLAKLLPRTRLFGGYWRTGWDFSSTIETEQVMGACLMLRRPSPLFDESYFLYCEDTDLCYRIRQAGGKIYYVHDAVFIHHLGASGEPQRAEMVIYYNKGKERYFRKFHGVWQARVCRWLNKMGALLRMLIGVGGVIGTLGRSERARQYAQVFWRVFRMS